MTRHIGLFLATTLFAITGMGQESVNPPTTSENEDYQEAEKDLVAERKAELQRQLDRRIEGEFTFEVIDQDNNPVPGVEILFEVSSMKNAYAAALAAGLPWEGSWLDKESSRLKTDANGLAYTKRVRANFNIAARIDNKTLNPAYSIGEKQKQWSENPDNPGFVALSQPEATRPGVTYIFRVIKHGRPEPLSQFEISRLHPGDGSTWYIEVFGSHWSQEEPTDNSWRPDFSVTAYRDPVAPIKVKLPDGTFSGPDEWRGDWHYSLKAYNGGAIVDQETNINSAPNDGYSASWSWSCDVNRPGPINVHNQKWWWRRSGSPDKYIRLETRLGVSTRTGLISCGFKGLVNPTGGQLIIIPTRHTTSNQNWVKWMTEDVEKALRNDPLGLIPVVPQGDRPSP